MAVNAGIGEFCYSLTSASSKRLRGYVVDKGDHEVIASPLYFWPRNSHNSCSESADLLDHWFYFDSMYPEP